MAKTDSLDSFLMDVALDGAAIISKRKLLWLMGKSHDRPSAWDKLLDHWTDLGMSRDDIAGSEIWNGDILLIRKSAASIEDVESWVN